MQSFLDLAAARYSVRKFLPAPVAQDKLDAILRAAALAPTACNNQPQRIFVVTDEAKRRALAAVTPCTFDAPVIFAVGYDTTRSAKGMIFEGYDFGETDAAIVCTHMMLAACDAGLGSCCVGYFREAEVKAALGLPEEVRVRMLLPVGYPDAEPAPLHTLSRPQDEMVTYL